MAYLALAMRYDYERHYYVYLLTNYSNSVIYTGMTNDLVRRVTEHREKANTGFTKQYSVWKLVYFEEGTDVEGALIREKQIKGGSRQAKVDLIKSLNPTWRDLFQDLQ